MTEPLASPPRPIASAISITVRNIVVRGDEDARQSVRVVLVNRLAVMPAGHWGAETGKTCRQVRSHDGVLPRRPFVSRACRVLARRQPLVVGRVQADDARPVLTITMSNGPVANQSVWTWPAAQSDLELAPGEERRVAVPVDASRGAAHVTMSDRHRVPAVSSMIRRVATAASSVSG